MGIDGISNSSGVRGTVPGLPTVRTLDHVGLSVSDLDRAVAIFVEVLGFEKLYAHVPAATSGETEERQFARHRETRLLGIAMLRLGTLNLELLQFDAPDQRREAPRTSDWGGMHLAFYVDDLDAAVAHLRDHDVRVLGEPMDLSGPEAGVGGRFVFAVLMDEIAIELVTYPGGKSYERTTSRRLFDPRSHPHWASVR